MGKFRTQTPGMVKKVVASWSTLKLEEGEGVNLWKVGPTLWFWSHYVNRRTIPCYHEFTGGEVKCPYCGTRDYWQGYTPCYDESGHRFIALPKESNKVVDDKIKPGSPVYVSRKKGPQKPMTIIAKPWAKPWVLGDTDVAAVADIESRLLVIWKDTVLADWFSRQSGEPVVPIKNLIEQATADQAAADDGAKELMRRRDEWMKVREAQPSDTPVSVADAMPALNGKHKRK